MSKDRIDASVGLTFSLNLFHRYRGSGILQAKIQHVPGIQGHGVAYVHLTQGVIIACYIDDKRGKRHHLAPNVLCLIDSEKGPFEWTFQPLPLPQTSVAQEAPTAVPSALSTLSDSCIPTVIAPLYWEPLSNWTLEQKHMLYDIWRMIDGKRTLREIKAQVAHSPEIVNEVLHTLIALHVISISS